MDHVYYGIPYGSASKSERICMHERMVDLRDFLTENGFVFAILVVMFLGVIAAWGFAYMHAGTTQYPFEFTITTEKATYKLQERIEMNVTLRNIGEENVTVVFFSMPNPNPYWFRRVYDKSQHLVFYHKSLTTAPSEEKVTFQPGEFMQSQSAWDQKATDTGQQVPPGIYYLTAVISFMYKGEEVNLETRLQVLIEP